jgi:hypothetical protein
MIQQLTEVPDGLVWEVKRYKDDNHNNRMNRNPQDKYRRTSPTRATDLKKLEKATCFWKIVAPHYIIFLSPISFSGHGVNGNTVIKRL